MARDSGRCSGRLWVALPLLWVLLHSAYSAATPITLGPTADAYVQDGTWASTNFGTATWLFTKTAGTNQNQDAYLKFDTSSLGGAGSVASAKLHINAAASANANVATTLYAVSNTTWSESTITWNNKPARGGALASTTVTGNSFIYYELDVSNYLIAEKAAGRNTVSFALHNPAASSQTIWIHSREATSSRPQLVITPNNAPSVNLTSPVAGAVFQAPATIALTANAVDPDGTVAKVDFFDGATLVGTATVAPYSVTLANVAAGTHTYTARATDNLGASTTSAAVGIKVNAAPSVSLTSPANGATFTAPATVPLAASAADGDGTIAKVEFFQGTSLIATVTTAPYTFTWTNVAQGNYTITAKATDNDGATAISAAVTIAVNSPIVGVSVENPANGAVVDSDTVTVSGTFFGPSNTGITVNGIVATRVGDTFIAANVPLQPGANTLTVTLTTPSNQTATQTLSLTSTGPAPIEVVASPAQGVAPLSVVFTINNRTGKAIRSVQADYSGTGSFANVDPRTLSNNYTASGLYQAAFVITDSTGASYQRTVPIAVQDTAQIDQMLQTAWWEFSTALAARDTAQALKYFNAQAQQKFQSVFQALATDLPQIVSSFSPPQLVSVTNTVGEYAINRNIGGVDRIFLIYFLQDVDGVWRLDAM